MAPWRNLADALGLEPSSLGSGSASLSGATIRRLDNMIFLASRSSSTTPIIQSQMRLFMTLESAIQWAIDDYKDTQSTIRALSKFDLNHRYCFFQFDEPEQRGKKLTPKRMSKCDLYDNLPQC